MARPAAGSTTGEPALADLVICEECGHVARRPAVCSCGAWLCQHCATIHVKPLGHRRLAGVHPLRRQFARRGKDLLS